MRDTLNNILAGARLALFLPVRASAFRFSWSQVWMMAAAGLLLSVGLDWSFTEPPRAFNGYGFHDEAMFLVLALLSAWLCASTLGRPELSIALPILWFSAALAAYPVQALIIRGWPDPGLEFGVAYGLGIAWWLLIVYRSLAALEIRGILRKLNRAALVVLVVTLPDWHFTPAGFWYSLRPLDTAAARPRLEIEPVLFSQQARLDEALQRLPQQTPGQTDLYAVGFASHGSQDVFMQEITLLEELGKKRFGDAARTLKLINNMATVNEHPLASRTNLEYALRGVSEQMDVEQDVLFVFITSHGSADHQLSVELANLPLESINPATLSQAISELPVRWKVIVVSACYSGGFLPALADPHTLVITAAHAERQSFGCSNEAELTWFGRAFLNEGLAQGLGFVEAFRRAEQRVSEWETENDYPGSEPQIAPGSEIVKKLAELGW